MTGGHGEHDALRAFLQAQRRSVLAIVGGLTERDMRRPALPSGWTALGMIEHLARAERFWFTRVITATADPPQARPPGEAETTGPLSPHAPSPMYSAPTASR
jgi:hypothetical protein